MISYRISDEYTSPNENFENGYPPSSAILQVHLNLDHYKPHEAAHHSTKCDIINDVKVFPAVYHRLYCRKFLLLSNQTSRYKIKCIRMFVYLDRWATSPVHQYFFHMHKQLYSTLALPHELVQKILVPIWYASMGPDMQIVFTIKLKLFSYLSI